MAQRSARITMTEGPLLGILLRVAVPITLTNLVQSSYDLINALWVGRLGEGAIAAIAASGPLFYVLISLGSGLATAGAVLIAQNAGAGRLDALDHVAAQTLLMVGAMALAFTIVGLTASPHLLRLIGVAPNVRALALDYLGVRYLGMVPMFGFMAMQGMLQAVGEVRFAMRVQIASLILNALLDPLLILGVGPVPGLGVMGAAIATVVAQLAALLIVFHHLLTGHSALHLRRHHFRPDRAHIWLATRLGVPAGLEQGVRTFSSLLLMSVAASFGTIGVASYGIGIRFLFFWFTPIIGLAAATATVVGQNIGAGLIERAEAASRLAAKVGFLGLTAIGLIQIPLVPIIMTALAPGEARVIEGASTFAYIYLPFLGLSVVQQTMLATFRGAGSTKQSMLLSMAQHWLFQLPTAFILSQLTPLGILGVWWCYPIGSAGAAGMGLLWFRYGSWRRRLVPSGGRDALAAAG
jgi:putative MATE family efflux protein